MDHRAIEELKQLVEFMRTNGVLTLTCEIGNITLHPSALRLDTGDITVETTGDKVFQYMSDYDDPMLYPGGRDPVAEKRDREEGSQ